MSKPPLEDLLRHDDPFAKVLLPPPNESPEDREKRVQAQFEAIRISRQIDESLLEAKRALDLRKKAVKVLLLGQAESGKSTTLRNFQLLFCPTQFHKERDAWRMIIQLNLIRCVRQILQILQEEWDSSPAVSSTATPSATSSLLRIKRMSSTLLTDEHRRIRMRLSPLLSLEQVLMNRLSFAIPNENEISVRGGSGWKTFLPKALSSNRTRSPTSSGFEGDETTTILSACRDDIVSLWQDTVVRQILNSRNIRLQEQPGFFLDDAARIAVQNYEPTDQDILKARIKTIGVEEHRLAVENGSFPGSEMYIYDVGGSRGTRSYWAPYFDDMQSIIFLAPLTFNMSLEEDPRVNRLEDSIMIWKSICSNRLLSGSTIILFLNKMDILRKTLAAGVQVKSYVPSYGDQPNDFPYVVKYFRDKFRAYHKKLSPVPRQFYWHETSVIDIAATTAILIGVRESILRSQLQDTYAL